MPVAVRQLQTYTESQTALGSTCDIVLCTNKSAEDVRMIFRALWLDILQFERRFSRFLPASELSTINRSAGLVTPISPECHALLKTAKSLAEETEGKFNPFILPALQRAGYIRSRVPGHEADTADDHRSKAVVSASKLELTGSHVTIPFNTALDLGGCGKGYLAEQLRSHPLLRGVGGFWISLGGDVVGAGHDDQRENWQISVRPTPQTPALGTIRASKQFAIATSGVGVHKGPDWHHLVDSASLVPATTSVLSATIEHASATWADVLASIAVMENPVDLAGFIRHYGATGVLIYDQTGAIRTAGSLQRFQKGVGAI